MVMCLDGAEHETPAVKIDHETITSVHPGPIDPDRDLAVDDTILGTADAMSACERNGDETRAQLLKRHRFHRRRASQRVENRLDFRIQLP